MSGQEPNLDAIQRTHRHALATRPTESDSWLNGYRDDVGTLLAALTQLQAERESFSTTPRVPMCRVTTSSSWHDPVRCAYAEDHPGDHSWASLPARSPLAEATQLRADLAHARLDATMGHTRAMQLRAERDAILVAFYQADAPECARVCDEVLDRSGALLGRVRDAALAPAPEAETT